MIFGAVDNNKSRYLIAQLADSFGIPAIIAGNGEWFGEAHLFLPEVYNPFDYFEFPDTDPTPWACNSDEALETSPQTAIANMMAAGAAMHIYLSLFKTGKPMNYIGHVRNEYNSGTVLRIKELVGRKSEKENEHSPNTDGREGDVTGTGDDHESMGAQKRG